jgi:hypothetical protein
MVEKILWKADCHSACQTTACFLYGTLRCSQNHATVPCLSQPNPVRPIDSCLCKVYLNILFPPTPRFSQWSLTFRHPNQNPLNIPPPHACHMSRPPHLPWFNRPNNIRWRIQAVKLIIIQFSPRSVFLTFRFKYLPQHSVLKNPQSMFLPQSKRPSFAPIQYNWKN